VVGVLVDMIHHQHMVLVATVVLVAAAAQDQEYTQELVDQETFQQLPHHKATEVEMALTQEVILQVVAVAVLDQQVKMQLHHQEFLAMVELV